MAPPPVVSLKSIVRPLTGAPDDFDPIIDAVGGARFALIGEASHGTHEFYRVRAEITKRLIRERHFTAIAVEADWPDAFRVNRYVRGLSDDADASDALAGFKRFPQWMWRNADVLDFVGWLRQYNDAQPPARRVGFYGLDLYSLHASIEAVLKYLRVVDPEAARRAQYRYGCFDQFGDDPSAYGYAAGFGLTPSCEREVVAQLMELNRNAATYAQRDGRLMGDDLFYAEQNARVVRNAEQYYRAMFGGRIESWNLRDGHMAQTLEALDAHLSAQGARPKIAVWAHNSHVGDARATELGVAGEHTLGQLVRQAHQAEAALVGFSTFTGTVTAASDWGAPAERKRVRPALPESYEALFHTLGVGNFAIRLAGTGGVRGPLSQPRLERAIGVIYRPETERASHYFRARLRSQFDAILHYDVTRAVEPLERTGEWEAGEGEVAETFPTAL
ncbi:MAG TPA: erythromycin esterase family protein [Gemmatimonadaceae bacterium]|nr:erythromycin esterase family protein [Gemmatimonadaceae bacterium]